jgi:putative heme iron utilization protein
MASMSPEQIRSIESLSSEKPHQILESDECRTHWKKQRYQRLTLEYARQKQARECLASANAGERYSGSQGKSNYFVQGEFNLQATVEFYFAPGGARCF